MQANLNAHTVQVQPLTVFGITNDMRKFPGNVGVCLSGGGSRACTAAMGQLRGLRELTFKGQSLLSQVKAISTVSGGSWLGVTFTFLTSGTSDAEFLNSYVADPGDLVPTKGSTVAVSLDKLPKGNMGEGLNSELFSIPALAVGAFLLWKFKKTPPNMLWQTLMGMHLLSGYGLHQSGENALPTTFFSVDLASRARIRKENPVLEDITCNLMATGPNRVIRPYLICNTSMFINSATGKQPSLVPVQATPWFTGIVSSPNATDVNGKPVGGGGVTSFAFNSVLEKVNGSDVQVSQSRQWSLTDIVGASSAAFAEELASILSDPDELLKQLVKYFDQVVEHIENKTGRKLDFDLPGLDKDESTPKGFFGALKQTIEKDAKKFVLKRLIKDVAKDLGEIIPSYGYWPVRNAAANAKAKPSQFADGGNLENTGLCNMLSYGDIDAVIAFVNSQTPMSVADRGIIDESGNEIPGTRILIDDQIPPLFGYQPFDRTRGYVLFPADTTSIAGRCRVFAPANFAKLLQGLWRASGNEAAPGSNQRPATFQQSLVTEQNDWFGVTGGRTVKIVWSYLNDVADWRGKLNNDVRTLLQSIKNFPNYRTFNTYRTNQEINLLSSMTAWTVASPENSGTFTSLFVEDT